ncbi:MAG: hypothetical protein M1823_004917 [Watsoniomyces obsoletus]|nr:MAG: hypothetical protein M1823_004917 [Watsoniomyces obsoletus]
MSRPSTAQIVLQLRSAVTASAQASALRLLRDDIVGHEQKKEECVRRGAIPVVLRSLQGPWPVKRMSVGPNGEEQVETGMSSPGWDARIQATIIIGSLAYGGPAYLEPLFQTSTVDVLLSSLSPSQSSSRLVLETLRTLDAIADSLELVLPVSSRSDRSLADTLCPPRQMTKFTEIVTQTSSTVIVQQQISLAARLLVKTCRDERHRAAAARAGVLDALATRLAGYLVATGFVLHRPGDAERPLPKPAPARAELDPILHALTTIISGSKHRARQLLRNADLVAVLAPSEHTLSIPFAEGQSHRVSSRIDYLLPLVPVLVHVVPVKNSSIRNENDRPVPERMSSDLAADTGDADDGDVAGRSSTRRPVESEINFNALDAGGCSSSNSGSSSSRSSRSSSGGSNEDESPLVAWLIHRVVDDDGSTRLMAAALLAELWRLGLVSKMRDRPLAVVVVPILVRMLDETTGKRRSWTPGYPPSNNPDWCRRRVEQYGPAVLAMLMTDSKEMQKSAVEAGAIKKLTQMLKAAYQPVTENDSAMAWNSQPGGAAAALKDANVQVPPECRMGHQGLSRTLSHKLYVRTASLQALAALATFKDEYRKKIIEHGVTPYLLESLKPYDTSMPSSADGGSIDLRRLSSVVGNPSHVMVAACGLARMLSRALSILRTSLIDAGIALPLFRLLTNDDIEVQIAATAAVCNLLLEFSPMRPTIMQAGALKVLCEHARSTNPCLRLNALWALKHLVASAENAVKVSCLEELGHDWLIRMIGGGEGGSKTSRHDGEDTHMEGTGAPPPHMEADYVPRDSSLEWDEEENVNMMRDDYGMEMQHHHRSTSPQDNSSDATQSDPTQMVDPESGGGVMEEQEEGMNVEEEEENEDDDEEDDDEDNPDDMPTAIFRPHRKGHSTVDTLAVQEQGLNLLRNIITGPKSDEMIDYLFAYFGQDQLYSILASKLRIRPVHRTSVIGGIKPSHINHSNNNHNSSSSGGDKYPFPEKSLNNNNPNNNIDKHYMISEPEIITGVCFILVHIAASHPRHRQALIQQTELLQRLVPFCRHSSRQVRTAWAWVVINLTWVDDPIDKSSCRTRAMELKRLGFLEGLEKIVKDPELDVKEQSRTALWQLRDLLGT